MLRAVSLSRCCYCCLCPCIHVRDHQLLQIQDAIHSINIHTVAARPAIDMATVIRVVADAFIIVRGVAGVAADFTAPVTDNNVFKLLSAEAFVSRCCYPTAVTAAVIDVMAVTVAVVDSCYCYCYCRD